MQLLRPKHLSDKILGFTMAFYLVVVFAITSWLIVITYRSAEKGVYRELNLYESTFSIPLTEILWSMDMDKLSSLIQGVVQIPEIIGARVLDPNTGTILYQNGWVIDFEDGNAKYFGQANIPESVQEDKKADEIFLHSFLLIYQPEGENQLIGKVSFFSDTNIIFDRIKYQVALMIGGAAVQLVLLWIFFSWISRRFISRPLTRLTQSVEAFDPDSPEDPAEIVLIKGQDELSVLSRAFSAMQQRLVESVGSLQKSQRELRHLNENLEGIVLERTVQLKKLSEAVVQSPASVVITDKSGTIEYVNPTFSEVTGYTAEEALGKNPGILKSGRLPETFYQDLWLTINSGRTWHGDFINRRKSGEEFWESASISPIKNEHGAITHFVAVKQDITERKQMEEALMQAKQAADEANKAKGDFLANMSHEIRTPMNAVIGMAHLALKTELTGKQRDYLQKIQSSANSLLGIINDILDFSKIEAGKLDMEAVDFNLDDVLDNLANLVTVKAREKENLEVLFAPAIDVPRFLVGDPLRLGQVLVNLANNAVKFTESGEIVVAIEKIGDAADRVTLEFSVSDTGIGLTREQMDRLFQSFSQADTSTTRKFGGTGLGLAISKRLVNMMGGDIRVESEYGRGTSFIFTAGFGHGKEKAKKRFAPLVDLRDLKALVVDDNATSREIFKDLLDSFSFEVVLSASGEEALAEIENAAKKKPFELVIMDWKMPEMDGIECANRIKHLPGLGKIPAIILVTAYSREEIMQKAEKAGLDSFLLKPVNPSILFDAIMQALGKELPETSRRADRRLDADVLEEIRGARILLVEDNEINQQVAKEILQGAGLNVTVANNGQEAVSAAKKDNYDAVLMDVQMPVMDGYTATKTIRKWECGMGNEGNDPIPIIAMTAHAMAGDEDKSLQAGMNGHVTKPINPDQLFSTLRKWIKPSEKRVQVQQLVIPVEQTETDKAAPAETELPESLSGFDLIDGLKRLQGNKKLFRKLLLSFAADYNTVANEIRKALDAVDFDQAHRLVHNLKGLAGNLAATDLQAAAVNLEKLVKGAEENAPPVRELNLKFSELENALNHALESARSLGVSAEDNIGKLSAEELFDIPIELSQDIAKRIRDAVEMGDVTRLNAIAEEIKDQSDLCLPLSKQIIQMAQDFDLDGIEKLADALDAY